MFLKIILLSLAMIVAATPEIKRVVAPKYSDEEPGTKGYDHEVFLGQDTAGVFDKLTPEESKRRLGIIFGKIDTDHDGIVTEEELEKWISLTQTRYVQEETAKSFEKHDSNEDGQVHWDEYFNATFGLLKNDADWKVGENQGFSYKDMHERDRKRWKVADRDDDDSCNKGEFTAFLHPQVFKHMEDVVLEETMNDMDVNKDGVLDLEEYINDVYKPQTKGEKEPDWVGTEREQFVLSRDKDQSGNLDKAEVKNWLMPDGYNHALAEAKHLIYESDSDQDGVLSEKEVIEHQDVFVGSQATDWGEIFNRHDEF